MLKIPFLNQADLQRWQGYMDRCNGCGLCIAACPLGRLSPGGLYSPRGRVALIRAFLEGRISRTEASSVYSVCLHCDQCEKACPSGLPLRDLFTDFAASLASSNKDPRHKALYLLQLLPSLSAGLRFVISLAVWTGLQGMFPPLPGDLPLKAKAGPYRLDKKAASRSDGSAYLLFNGCLARYIDPSIAKASASLVQNSSRSLISARFPCCGRINRLRGKKTESLALVRKNLKILSGLEFGHILSPCPACCLEISHYWPRTKGLDKNEKEFAEKIAEKVLDPASFVSKTLSAGGWPENSLSESFFFHISCLSSASSLTSIKTLFPTSKFAMAENGENCCGASLFCSMGENKVSRQLSGRLGRMLRDEALAQGAGSLFTTCPACKLHLKKILSQCGDAIPVVHIAELFTRIAAARG